MQHLVFVLNHFPNPRLNRRLRLLQNDAQLSVICIDRQGQNIGKIRLEQVAYYIQSMDLPDSSHLLRRAIISRRFHHFALHLLHQLKPDVIYTEGLDALLSAAAYKKRAAFAPRLVYEVADLRERFLQPGRNFIDEQLSSAVRRSEERALSSVDRLVVTSPKFYEVRYAPHLSSDRVLFIPNAPDPAPFSTYRPHQGAFTVGFIGSLRYVPQMKQLIDAARIADCQVLFAGGGSGSTEQKELEHYAAGDPRIRFYGAYNYDRDIAALYGQVDAVYAVYNNENPNVKLALPNKLYEAALCGLPLLVASQTYLADIVTSQQIGIAVDPRAPHPDAPDSLATALRRLKDDAALRHALGENGRKQANPWMKHDAEQLLKEWILQTNTDTK